MRLIPFGKDKNNRAEVPDVFEFRLILALVASLHVSLGCLDISNAFLNAELDGLLDGVYLVEPPAYLFRNGFAPARVYWKLKKALYGLRQVPEKWQQRMDKTVLPISSEYKGKT